MLVLCDGLGQLGTALQKYLKTIKREVYVYHKWNFLEKSGPIQYDCYLDFIKFVDEHPDKEICFISTYSKADDYYVKYKRLAEKYLELFHSNSLCVRLPILIGKGICEKFRNDEAKPFGQMEIMTVEDAAKEVVNAILESKLIGKSDYRIQGEKISADLVYNLIKWGKNGSL